MTNHLTSQIGFKMKLIFGAVVYSLILLNFFNIFVKSQDVSVTIPLGGTNFTIQGQFLTTTNGYRMRAFLGVPYAQTPPQRFNRTSRLTTFSPNPYNAANARQECARWGADSKALDTQSSEDCLYLKILIPANITCCIPVMFWIQGGGLNDGGYQAYDNNALGDNFVSKGVIIVQVNHRQGPLGFYTTGTADAQGNWGVWDALEALTFVRTNINAFGGDQNKITIMGEESGAVMAELLSLTPLANSSYSAMILLGGTAFDPAVIKNDDVNIQRAQRLSIAVNCDNSTLNRWNTSQRAVVLDCLRNTATLSQIVSAIGRPDIAPSDPGSTIYNYYWRPRVDGVGGLFPESFETLATRRPIVPTMIGINKDDWLFELYLFVNNIANNNTLPADFNTTYNVPAFVNRTCQNLLTNEIYGATLATTLRNSCIQKYVQFVLVDSTDQYFWAHRGGRVSTGFHLMAPVYKTVNYMRLQGNPQVFMYSFDYSRDSQGSYWQALGASRYLEIDLVENFAPNFVFNSNDTLVRDLFSDYLTNFAKFQNPTPSNYTRSPTWNNYGGGNCYMSINTSPSMKPLFYSDDALFWILNGGLN